MDQPTMRTTDSRAVLLLAFVMTLAAGMAGGMFLSRSRANVASSVSARSPLDDLQLSADQTQQMRKIWESVRDSVQTCQMRGQSLRQQRDKAMEALLTDEQKAKFEKVDQDYNAQILALNSQRQTAFQNGVSQTNAILNERQRKTYERILRTRTGREPGQPLLEDPTAPHAAAELGSAP
jgi:Spy/CpxP family protein refolding chaperone